MNVETVFTKSTVREVLALNMLGKIKSQIEWVSLFFVNFAFGDMRLFWRFNLIFFFFEIKFVFPSHTSMLFFFTHSINYEFLLSMLGGKTRIQSLDFCRMGKIGILFYLFYQVHASNPFCQQRFLDCLAPLDSVQAPFSFLLFSKSWLHFLFPFLLEDSRFWPFFKVSFQLYHFFLLLEAEASFKP